MEQNLCFSLLNQSLNTQTPRGQPALFRRHLKKPRVSVCSVPPPPRREREDRPAVAPDSEPSGCGRGDMEDAQAPLTTTTVPLCREKMFMNVNVSSQLKLDLLIFDQSLTI